MKKLLMTLIAIIFILGTLSCYCLADNKEETEVTVYNQNFAVVKATRVLNIPRGGGEVKFQDVATGIDSTSVHFKSLTEPEGCKVLDQNYEYDLVSSDKLLYKYIDQNINVITKDSKQYGGKLMSFDAAQLVLAEDKNTGPITMVSRENIRDIQFPSLPSGLITRPTLVWNVLSDKGGEQLIEVSYLTSGMTWQSDYTVVVSGDDKSLDLGGWVTITNSSGAAYKDAKLKLIAGDVHRVTPTTTAYNYPEATRSESAPSQGFQEKSFFEYHMYTLGRTATIKENQIKQIELLTAASVPMDKIYIYDGAPTYNYYYDYFISDASYGTQCNKKVSVMVEFMNSEKNNLGIPLPKGKVRVYKRDDADSSLEFIGEDSIDHTPKDELVRLFLGDAFDIVGERTQLSFEKISDSIYDETFQIKLRNHKKEAVTVKVVEHLYRWVDWKITESSQDYAKVDSRTIEFKADIPADGEKVLKYKVRYQY